MAIEKIISSFLTSINDLFKLSIALLYFNNFKILNNLNNLTALIDLKSTPSER